jgi:hypothetical protein
MSSQDVTQSAQEVQLDPPILLPLPQPLAELDPAVLIARLREVQVMKRRCQPSEINEAIEIMAIIRKTTAGPGKPRKKAASKVKLADLMSEIGVNIPGRS